MMGWMSSGPPINPREVQLFPCPDCKGTGEQVDFDGPLGPIVARVQWCDACEGRGEREYFDDDVYVPDTWKEAEGLA
jgi:DnaJ-class molecular chaperone